jgi:two-component system cell cycle sensor histidine kinase/response regulator CckA
MFVLLLSRRGPDRRSASLTPSARIPHHLLPRAPVPRAGGALIGMTVDVSRTRILVVEDEESNRTLAERVLTSAGYEVRTAANALDALALIPGELSFELFLLDIMMPGMQGTELAERIRAIQPDAKILFFTGYSEPLFQGRSVLRPHEAFVQKPVGIRDLAEAVSQVLFGHPRGPAGARKS